MKRTILTLTLALLIFVAHAQEYHYTPSPENMRAREEFRDAKFGIFIHWGLYAMLATGEWTMTNRDLNYKEYAQLAGGFYPSKFDADEWVQLVKDAGAKYICITSRHHDGFSMFGSKQTNFNIVDATPFKRDVLKELADACAKHGIKLHFYYSLIDWSREDAVWGRTGRGTGRPNPSGDWASYYAFMNNQLTELLTNYGQVGAIWFDGVWDQDQNPNFDWQLPYQYDLIHRLQPSCLVANNHHIVPMEGEDIQVFERDLPGENNAGYSGESGISDDLPLETCETMNGMWGYRIADQNYKDLRTLVHYLVRAAGKNANLLLNIGPQPDGQFPTEAKNRLKQLGEWMRVYGTTIHGTRAGIVAPHPWGVSTQKGRTLYLHILDLNDPSLFVEIDKKKIAAAVDFATRSRVRITAAANGCVLEFDAAPTEIDKIIEITLK